ncbi:MAG: STAS domain-containing protein [Methylotenera sp.]|uniref:STAS domain-containing protein n=1 Tax=Methylotenera sp. TaxID=2051956 RepID=UPI00182C4D2F|nr:STAS domain-containing protein [Methylotenera sp.]NOU25858.1 STAS domain-containing protein [Methylotenera sp.]
MAEIILPNIVQIANKWHVSGDVLMDNANLVLNQSDSFAFGDEVEIDFADVINVDTAALSLILEWQRRAVASYCKLKFSNLPTNLASLATLYGVETFIPLS